MMRLFEGTELDRPPRCDECGELLADCPCPPPLQPEVPTEQQVLKLAVEKRKKGKVVTVIRGLAEGNSHTELLTALKSACGAGGTLSTASTIEIQGNHQERIRTLLQARGFQV